VGAVDLGHLHCRTADRAGCSAHENRLALAGLEDVQDRLVRGEGRDAKWGEGGVWAVGELAATSARFSIVHLYSCTLLTQRAT
jgi:hypothetical protein